MKRWIILRAARVLHRFAIDENYRNAALVRWTRPDNLFQPDNYTAPDRYPEVFQLAAKQIGDGPDRRILSFGCSTGEEVFALRQYFPRARLEGIDINRHNVSICRRKLARRPDPGIGFKLAASLAAAEGDAYDAIFCMAVFRHGGLTAAPPDRCDDRIRFADFERETGHINRCLKAGGLLLIEWCAFRFCDTRTYADFEPIHTAAPAGSEPIYDRDNRLIPGGVYRDVAFRKVR
jgi:SAM-dependent methyltransferase